MTGRVAIVADDLTGALDAAGPFAASGRGVRVWPREPTTPGAWDVCAVATASRALRPAFAAASVRRAVAALAPGEPSVWFKKIDSRLQGPVEAEVAAMIRALRPRRVIVASAIPAAGRSVRDGRIVGTGVGEGGTDVAARLADLPGPRIEIPEASDQRAIDALLRELGPDLRGVLLVGASGLARALAARGARTDGSALRPARAGRFLAVIGSRDPITLAQLDRLRALRPDVTVAGGGAGRDPEPDGPLILRPDPDAAGGGLPALATRAARSIRRRPCGTLFLSGGDTALAVLRVLRIASLVPTGSRNRVWSRRAPTRGTV